MSYLLSSFIHQFGGELHGADIAIERLAPLDQAKLGDISFVSSRKYYSKIATSQASAIIIKPECSAYIDPQRSWIITPDPYLYFAKVATLLTPTKRPPAGIHPSAIIGHDCQIAVSASIGPGVILGDRVVIQEHACLYPGVVVGDDCLLGNAVTLYPNVTVYAHSQIGNRVIIHAGAVIGGDGFGLAWDKDHWFKIPQTGKVILEDDVEIGANTTIDRGALLDTIIRRGAKIDNLVQIAHNVEVGEHTAIAGCVGIAGSTKIGANCTIGGAAMLVGHIDIADKTHIGGGTLVSKSIKMAGNYASSYPLQKMTDWMNNAVHLRHLDDLVKRVKKLETELNKEDGFHE